MATLELEIAEEAVTQPARKGRRLGMLFWVAIGWLIFVFAVAIFADRAAAAEPDRHGHAGAARAVFGGALAWHRRAWPRRALAADLRRADIAGCRRVRAGDRARRRRRTRHARGLFPRPVRVDGGRQHGRAAGVSALDPGAGRDRLSWAVDFQPDLDSRRARRSRLHAGGAGVNADAGAARIRHRGTGAGRHTCADPVARTAAECHAAAVCLPARRAVTIVVEGSLSFLGPRRAAADIELGQHDRGGRESLDVAPRLAFLPAAAMFLPCFPSTLSATRCVRLPIHVRARCDREYPAFRPERCRRFADAARQFARGGSC